MSAHTPTDPRILQVVLSLDPGGTQRLVLELVGRLHAEIPMAVCCLDSAGPWAAELNGLDVAVTPLHRSRGFRPSLGRQIAEAARRHDANMIHAHHYSPFVYSALARFWNRSAQVLFTEHGRLAHQVPSPKRRLANHLLERSARHVVAVSNDLRSHLVEEGFRKESVQVIYNGISLAQVPTCAERAEIRSQLGLRADTLLIGTIARLDPVKDLGTLIRSVDLLARNRDVALVIIGDGPERAHLESLAARCQKPDTVVFLGQRDDARRWLAGCDVYVNSSISEGVSLTILEAMAAALPVVATHVGGTPEVVDAACGTLVDARNPEALAAAIERVAVDPSLRRRLGDAARRRVEERFSIEQMVGAYRSLYRGTA